MAVDVFEKRTGPCHGDVDTVAIAALTLENHVEIRDSVEEPHDLVKRELGVRLRELAPQHCMESCRMVSFTDLPHACAGQRRKAQDALLDDLLGAAKSIRGVDVQAAVEAVRARLPALPVLRRG